MGCNAARGSTSSTASRRTPCRAGTGQSRHAPVACLLPAGAIVLHTAVHDGGCAFACCGHGGNWDGGTAAQARARSAARRDRGSGSVCSQLPGAPGPPVCAAAARALAAPGLVRSERDDAMARRHGAGPSAKGGAGSRRAAPRPRAAGGGYALLARRGAALRAGAARRVGGARALAAHALRGDAAAVARHHTRAPGSALGAASTRAAPTGDAGARHAATLAPRLARLARLRARAEAAAAARAQAPRAQAPARRMVQARHATPPLPPRGLPVFTVTVRLHAKRRACARPRVQHGRQTRALVTRRLRWRHSPPRAQPGGVPQLQALPCRVLRRRQQHVLPAVRRRARALHCTARHAASCCGAARVAGVALPAAVAPA